MSAEITVVVGPARCGKTERLLEVFRAELARVHDDRRLNSTLWLAPNRRAADQVRTRLLRGSLRGCFAPGVRTFDQFAGELLLHADDEMRPIDAGMKRQLVERLIREALDRRQLRHFAGIATTPGFLDLVCAFISELKRVEIWPEDFSRACAERLPSQAGEGLLSRKDRELAALYQAYQDLLVGRLLYDAEGRFWSARELLRLGRRAPFEDLRLIVVDGFTDFSRTQLEMLDELARRVDRMYVSLVDESEPGRDDLFAKTRTTLRRLHERHPQLVVERLERCASAGPPGLRHVERELFKSPRLSRSAESAEGIEIVEAAGAVVEIETLARRIKRLLLDGDAGRAVRPEEIVVVFRSADSLVPLLREKFVRYGLPTAFEPGLRLDQSPALTALTALMELDRDDWPFRKLLGVVSSNFFSPSWPEWRVPGALEAVERTIRHLQISGGRQALLTAVERLAASADVALDVDDPEAEVVERRNLVRAEARLALPILQRLAAAFDALPQRASAVAWTTALDELAQETGLNDRADDALRATSVNDPGEGRTDHKARARFRTSLGAADDLAALLEVPLDTYDRRRLVQRMADVIRLEQLPGDHDEAGRIRVLTAVTARSLAAPYVFVVGLNETSFPAGELQGRLYGEAEYLQLARAGLPLPMTGDRRCDEMLLFYDVVTRAERRLYLSYAALNDKAEPLLPSPFLVELEQALGSATVRRVRANDLSPLPPEDEPLNPFDLPIRAVAAAAQGRTAELAAVRAAGDEAAANLAAALRVVDARSRGDGFGVYEGSTTAPEARRRLQRRFGPDYPFSASSLEQYAQCPFQFYLSRVLKVRPCADVELEIDRRRRGSRLHRLLAALHGELDARDDRPTPAGVEPAAYSEMVERRLAECLAQLDEHPLAAAFAEIDRRLLARWLNDYVEQHRRYDGGYKQADEPVRPRLFETSFGLPRKGADPVSTATPLRIELEEQRILITGRIDRIDVGVVAGRAVFSVIDYKTGSARGKNSGDVGSGRALQLTLYALAAEELLFSSPTSPWQCGYWFIAEGGFKKTVSLYKFESGVAVPVEPWDDLKQRLRRHVAALARGIRRGEFPMFNRDDKCTSVCDFRTVCRVGQTRSLEKVWQPPAPG